MQNRSAYYYSHRHRLAEGSHVKPRWEHRGEEVFVTENCNFHTPQEVVHDGSNERESFVLSKGQAILCVQSAQSRTLHPRLRCCGV